MAALSCKNILLTINEQDDTQQIFRDLSDTFSVRKMQLLGGQRPPQDLWWPKGPLMYLGAAFGRPRNPRVASGRLKVAFS